MPSCVEVHRRPAPNRRARSRRPTLLPTRTASFVPTTDVTATEAATGKSRTPVPSGVKSFTNWKYWVTRKMKP